jgi:hypothetical protein
MQLAHHRRTGGAFRGDHRDRSRGAVLVEAVFVTPIFFMLVFGILEVSLAMNDNLALASSVRAGTRVASASGSDAYADYGIIRTIQRESAALPRSQINYIVVYKATGVGAAPDDRCRNGESIDDLCNVYRPGDFDRPKVDWGCKDAKNLDEYWCPMDRKVSLSGAGPDYVGVWMQVEHPWLTRMFGTTLTLDDSSVIRLEPRIKTGP